MYAITPSPLSFRAISSAIDLLPGEVAIDDLPIGGTTLNCVWDATLNSGAGGVRLMTPTELNAAQSTLSALQTTENQTITGIQNLLHLMTSTTPFTALSQAQQTNYNVAIGRAVLFLIRASSS